MVNTKQSKFLQTLWKQSIVRKRLNFKQVVHKRTSECVLFLSSSNMNRPMGMKPREITIQRTPLPVETAFFIDDIATNICKDSKVNIASENHSKWIETELNGVSDEPKIGVGYFLYLWCLEYSQCCWINDTTDLTNDSMLDWDCWYCVVNHNWTIITDCIANIVLWCIVHFEEIITMCCECDWVVHGIHRCDDTYKFLLMFRELYAYICNQ